MPCQVPFVHCICEPAQQMSYWQLAVPVHALPNRGRGHGQFGSGVAHFHEVPLLASGSMTPPQKPSHVHWPSGYAHVDMFCVHASPFVIDAKLDGQPVSTNGQPMFGGGSCHFPLWHVAITSHTAQKLWPYSHWNPFASEHDEPSTGMLEGHERLRPVSTSATSLAASPVVDASPIVSTV